ncbi:hypothetical protein [Sphingomonas glacialis]|uniref:Uncharacterized protein n=1 Tax=Sphingomonas glacialis TaxID=658225 RepID=A0A502FR99_9SPHN|nr:hypothetical protein [Sphingomonas glacialis]TPG51676.1 hypothetical protein EAH76_16820 [Sphingomonas glacialis]
MNLALTVLHAATYRAASVPIATSDVRLALRVLYPFPRDQTDLRAYWESASNPRDRPWEGCHNSDSRIVSALLEKDCAVNAELR